MNRTYKVVFNHITRTWTAVNEFKKSHKKSSAAKVLSALAIGAFCGLTSLSAAAQTSSEGLMDPEDTSANPNTSSQQVTINAGISSLWTSGADAQPVVRNEPTINIAVSDNDQNVGILVGSSGSVDLTADQINIEARNSSQSGYGILSMQPENGSPAKVPTVNLSAKTINVQALGGGKGIETNWGSQIKLAASESVSVKATANTGSPQGLIIEGYSGDSPSLLDIQAPDISVTASSRGEGSADVLGIYLRSQGAHGHTLLLGTEETSKTVTINAQATGYARHVFGIEAGNGKAIIGSNNTAVSISALNAGFDVENGFGRATGISIQGKDTEVVINGSRLDVIADSGLKGVGIRVRDNAALTVNAPTFVKVKGGENNNWASDGIRLDNNSFFDNNGTPFITPGTREVVFNKSVEVDVSAAQGVRGIAVLLGAVQNLESGNTDGGNLLTLNSGISVIANSTGGNGRGISLDNLFLDGSHHNTTIISGAGAGNNMKITGNTSVSVSGYVNAMGIHEKDKADLTAEGNLNISAVSQTADAYGVRLEGPAGINVSGETIEISAETKGTTKEAAAYGVFAESSGSNAVLSASTINISASAAGEDPYATAVALSAGTSVSIGRPGANITLSVPDGQEAVSIKGDGTLTLIGSVSIPKGEIYVEGGSMTVRGDISLEKLDRINPYGGNAVKIDGTLTTTSDQIFTIAAGENVASVGAVKDDLSHQITFEPVGSTLVLTDPVVTFDYYKNAIATYTVPESIVMTGQMKDLTPEGLGQLTNPELPNTTLTWNSDVTIGASEISGSYAVVGDVNLGNGQSVTIDAGKDKTFTIGGKGGKFIESTLPHVEVVVKSEGTLQIGGTNATEDGTINGSLTAESNAVVNIKGAFGKTLTTINISGTLTADTDAKITVDDNAHVTVSEVKIAKGATFTVGSPEKKGVFGKMIANHLAQFGILFIDPDWSAQASIVAAENPTFSSESQTIVGQNSQLILGSQDPDVLTKALSQSGKIFAENGITAAVYIAKPVDLQNSSLVVDGAVNSPVAGESGTVQIAKDGFLGVSLDNETALGIKQVISGADLTLDPESFLYLNFDNVSEGGELNILLADKVNGLEELYSENRYKIVGSGAGLWYGFSFENGKITANYDPTQKMSNLIAPNTIRASLLGNTPYAATVRDLIENEGFEGASRELNRTAAVGASAGTQIVALNAGSMIVDTVEKHGSLLMAYYHDKAGADLWIDLNSSFSKASSYSVGSAAYGYKSDLAGATFGADYAFGNGFAAGAAFSIGTGSLRGQNLGSGVKNSVDYYGLNVYGTWSTDYVNVIGSVGYLHTKNKISSHLGSKVKPDGNAVTVALRAEKTLELNPSISVTPHLGVRYTFTDIDDFNQGGFRYTNKKTNLVQVPIGVAFNANLKAPCGAEVKPFIDVSIAPAFGDRKAKNKFGLASGAASDTLKTRIADNAVYSARVGVNATKGAHSFGLNYGIGSASHGRVDQYLQAGYRFAF